MRKRAGPTSDWAGVSVLMSRSTPPWALIRILRAPSASPDTATLVSIAKPAKVPAPATFSR